MFYISTFPSYDDIPWKTGLSSAGIGDMCNNYYLNTDSRIIDKK